MVGWLFRWLRVEWNSVVVVRSNWLIHMFLCVSEWISYETERRRQSLLKKINILAFGAWWEWRGGNWLVPLLFTIDHLRDHTKNDLVSYWSISYTDMYVSETVRAVLVYHIWVCLSELKGIAMCIFFTLLFLSCLVLSCLILSHSCCWWICCEWFPIFLFVFQWWWWWWLWVWLR